MSFRIRLFAGKGKYVGGVIVEVQRRNGWNPSYQQDCFAVLESAECDLIGDGDNLEDTALPVPGELVQTLSEEPSSLELPKLLLSNNKLESNLLGLESVASFIDSRKCGHETALRTARALFLDAGNMEVLDVVKNLILKKKMGGNNVPEEALERAHLTSFNIVMNATTLLSQTRELRQLIARHPWVENYLVTVLMNELNDATNPHKAAAAARCLNMITKVSVAATSKAIELGALRVLESAHELGARVHAKLAHETKMIRKNIQMM